MSERKLKFEHVIDLENVTIQYGNGPEVLKDINLKLKPGAFHFLTGNSGAGKTSLLSLLYIAHRPSKGTIRLFDKDIHALNRQDLPFIRRRIGVVFQDYRLMNHLSAFDNVALPLRVMGVPGSHIRKHVPELLEWVGLKDYMHATPPTLSGGQKQRIAIARAVINRPDILLADEPTGNVDEFMAMKLLHLFVELNKLGTCVVIATHSSTLLQQFDFPRLHLENHQLIEKPPASKDKNVDFDFAKLKKMAKEYKS